jgi:hypothetical protein
MVLIVLAWALTGKRFKLAQAIALIANSTYLVYSVMIAQIPMIILGITLSCINTFNLYRASHPKKKLSLDECGWHEVEA